MEHILRSLQEAYQILDQAHKDCCMDTPYCIRAKLIRAKMYLDDKIQEYFDDNS